MAHHSGTLAFVLRVHPLQYGSRTRRPLYGFLVFGHVWWKVESLKPFPVLATFRSPSCNFNPLSWELTEGLDKHDRLALGGQPFRRCVEVPVLGEVIWSSLTWGASPYRMRLRRPAISWSGISLFEDNGTLGNETVVDDFLHLASLGSLSGCVGYNMFHSLGFHFDNFTWALGGSEMLDFLTLPRTSLQMMLKWGNLEHLWLFHADFCVAI